MAFSGSEHLAQRFPRVASAKNRNEHGDTLHTNFQLDKGGEYLALVDPTSNVVSDFFLPFPQLTDVSYGRDGPIRLWSAIL